MSYAETVAAAPALAFWATALVVAGASALAFGWGVRLLHRASVIANTPTSMLRSAAQGFAEFEGRGHLLPGPPIVAPLTSTPCLWYRIKVMERSREGQARFEVVRQETSDDLFLLRDSSGECVVDPTGARIKPNVSLSWSGDNLFSDLPPKVAANLLVGGRFVYTEERLEVGTRLYVLGWFSTHGGSQEVPDTPGEVRSLLNQWKRDYAALLRRFDGNSDGIIDAEEWNTVRKAADVEVKRHQRERFGSGTVNLISRPPDGRPFVISPDGQEVLIRRWRRRSLWAFAAFVVFAALAAWLLVARFS